VQVPPLGAVFFRYDPEPEPEPKAKGKAEAKATKEPAAE